MSRAIISHSMLYMYCTHILPACLRPFVNHLKAKARRDQQDDDGLRPKAKAKGKGKVKQEPASKRRRT